VPGHITLLEDLQIDLVDLVCVCVHAQLCYNYHIPPIFIDPTRP
jgi:hypothetical protein